MGSEEAKERTDAEEGEGAPTGDDASKQRTGAEQRADAQERTGAKEGEGAPTKAK